MAVFLTTADIVAETEKVIKGAKERLVLVSPYIQMSRTLLERLQDADGRNVDTTLIYGKVDLSPDQREKLATLEGLSLYFSENLHAKCYFNETHMVIGSMNLYQFSERNNREMGLLITFRTDRRAYKGAVEEVESITRSAVQEQGPRTGKDGESHHPPHEWETQVTLAKQPFRSAESDGRNH